MNARWLACALALIVPTLLGYACKGGGDVSVIEVLVTSPEDMQTEVPVETRIGFRINAPIDPASLTTETFFLTDEEGTVVPATVFVGDEPDVARLQPEEPLAVITTFTGVVTTGLRSAGGATLERDFEWEFTTLDSAWGVDGWLEEVRTGMSREHQIAVDAQSNALAVWEYEEPTGTRIWANRYTRVDLWGEPTADPEPIDGDSQLSRGPRLATDDDGNGFAVWEQSDDGGTTANIWTNRYVVEDGDWGVPQPLQNGEVTPAGNPSISADPMGNAVAVWQQRPEEGGARVVWAIRYEGGAWGTAASIDAVSETLITNTAVGMDDQGNAIAVWSRPSGLWANRYDAGSGDWEGAELIRDNALLGTDPRDERLAVGPKGDAFVIWVENNDLDSTQQDIWARRFSGSTWEPPRRLDNYAGDKQQPDIALDAQGVGHAVWAQDDPDFDNIYANTYTPGPGWGGPELIEPPNEDPNEDGDAAAPRVGVNAAGNVFVVWRQFWDNWNSIWSNRRDPGNDWTAATAELIEQSGRAAGQPKIVVDDNRHAHAVWLHSVQTGTDWVRTNRFE